MAQCGCVSRKLRFRHYYQILFLQVALFHIPPLRVLEVQINGIRGITIYITESKIHISYSGNHVSTLFFNYFYMLPLPTIAHIVAKRSAFSISSPFDVTKLQKNCLDVSSTGIFLFPTSMDTRFHILYSSQCSRKLWFRHYYQ